MIWKLGPVGLFQFQSTPVIANGRILAGAAACYARHTFQSTPVIANGRIGTGEARGVHHVAVSIHARYC